MKLGLHSNVADSCILDAYAQSSDTEFGFGVVASTNLSDPAYVDLVNTQGLYHPSSNLDSRKNSAPPGQGAEYLTTYTTGTDPSYMVLANLQAPSSLHAQNADKKMLNLITWQL